MTTFTGPAHHHRTPESSSYNNNDYFTYISTNQHGRPSLPQITTSSNDEEGQDQPNKIPEIRLAPPIHMEQQQQEQEQAYPNTLTVMEDNASLHVPSMTPLKQQQQQQDDILLLKESVSVSMWFDDICCTLFPTLQDWNSKTSFAQFSALVAVPLVLIFTLTLPIAEGDDVKIDDIEVMHPPAMEESASNTPQIVIGDQLQTPQQQQTAANTKSYLAVPVSERSLSDMNMVTEEEEVLPLLMDEDEGQLGWCRWLVATQAICASTFVSGVIACKFELYR